MRYSSPETTTVEKLNTAESRIASKPEIVGLQSYEYLLNNSANVREQFINDPNMGSPDLRYYHLDAEELVILAGNMHTALLELQSGPRGARVDALYNAIEVRYGEIHMLQLAAMLQDPNLTATERAEVEEWFRGANEAIFGKPDETIFASIADKRIYDMLDIQVNPQSEQHVIQQELKGLVGNKLPETIPRTELFTADQIPEHVKRLMNERFDPYVEHIDTEQVYDLAEIKDELTKALDLIGGTEKGWKVDEIINKDHLAVSAHRRVVEVGENRDTMNGDELRAKIVHEVLVHVQRSINAQEAGWVSAAYGQDGYLDFEESFANMCGATYWEAGGKKALDEHRYLIAGFAYGMDGRPKRNFRDCYEISWRAMALSGAFGDQLTPDVLNRIRTTAYQQTVRMFRGTFGDVPGLLFLKDLAYVHGRKMNGDVLPLITCQEDIDLLLSSKTDPTKPDHLDIADQIAPGSPLATRLRELQESL